MDLADLCEPSPRIVTIRREEIGILPLRMRQMSAFSKASGPVFGQILSGDWKSAIDENEEAMRRAIAVAIERPEAWVWDLYQHEFMELTIAVLEVNLDFFVRRVLPSLVKIRMLAQAMAMTQGSAMSLPSLSASDTPPKTH